METESQYRSLEAISDRKDVLIKEIRKDEQQVRQLWNQLFAKPEPLSALTPSKRISAMMNTGAGVLDGVILGWKLYRKFKKKK
ncbi:MAG: hypothetical protein IJV36_00760 [Prevotella sp.]|nr:hypothetical protein [Prevotella sp.]